MGRFYHHVGKGASEPALRIAQPALHSSGKNLPDLADVVIDNCTPGGDALVAIPGLQDLVGPGSTIGASAVTNALKCRVAEKLVALGKCPSC